MSGTLKGGGGEGLKVSAAAMRLYLPSHLATLQRFAYACARNCVSACGCVCFCKYVCVFACVYAVVPQWATAGVRHLEA